MMLGIKQRAEAIEFSDPHGYIFEGKEKAMYLSRLALRVIALPVIPLLALSAGAVPSEKWNRTYSNALFYDVQQTRDDGYILAGMTRSFESSAYLIKTDASGNEEWNRSFDENIDKFDSVRGGFNSVQQTSDNGSILAETASYDNSYSYYARIIKIDSSGNTEWIRKFKKVIRL